MLTRILSAAMRVHQHSVTHVRHAMHAVWCTAALDMTGCFQWVALHLTRMSKGNGLALFLLYYTLSSVLTIFTSNDVSIMALTVSNTSPDCDASSTVVRCAVVLYGTWPLLLFVLACAASVSAPSGCGGMLSADWSHLNANQHVLCGLPSSNHCALVSTTFRKWREKGGWEQLRQCPLPPWPFCHSK